MEDKSTGGLGIINWLARLTRKVTSGKIVPMYYGENSTACRRRLSSGCSSDVDNCFK